MDALEDANWPLGQGVQLMDPSDGENDPAGQAAQSPVVTLGAYPAVQVRTRGIANSNANPVGSKSTPLKATLTGILPACSAGRVQMMVVSLMLLAGVEEAPKVPNPHRAWAAKEGKPDPVIVTPRSTEILVVEDGVRLI